MSECWLLYTCCRRFYKQFRQNRSSYNIMHRKIKPADATCLNAATQLRSSMSSTSIMHRLQYISHQDFWILTAWLELQFWSCCQTFEKSRTNVCSLRILIRWFPGSKCRKAQENSGRQTYATKSLNPILTTCAHITRHIPHNSLAFHFGLFKVTVISCSQREGKPNNARLKWVRQSAKTSEWLTEIKHFPYFLVIKKKKKQVQLD